MNISQIEEQVQQLFEKPFLPENIYDLLKIYGLPKASITRLRKGNLNMSKNENEIIWKKKLHFVPVQDQDLHQVISRISTTLKYNERFVIVTDGETLLAYDSKTLDTLDIAINEFPQYFDFFLPWAGIEKTAYQNENPADVKAAEKMAKLFDEIKKDNPREDDVTRHNLNVFLSRILFCLFAEDTGIFEEDLFTNAIGSHTKADGSDLHEFMERLFDTLNTSPTKRRKIPAYLSAFPYVNGGLFQHSIASPTFTRKSRQAIISAGTLQWKDINPDIFGSMFQAVIGADQRGTLGQHYTSVPNIMKVIEPLFLNELREAFENAKGNTRQLEKLLGRIWKIKIFDPACGSGNFLIIAYKELRKLEIDIFQELNVSIIPLSCIELRNFYGIEYDDFAGEIAKLALWLAEHQMNTVFKDKFGKTRRTLPLKEAGHIVHGNACRLDWEEVCPKGKDDEIYILGNPPYLGSSMQSAEQKEDMRVVFNGFKNYKNLDYISIWFKKGADYIKQNNSSFAFVSTNSICQGEQVNLLWPYVFNNKLEIGFAHNSFKWENNAKGKAAVIVVIIGVRNLGNEQKILYRNNHISRANNINGYLIDAKNVSLDRRSKPLSNIPRMIRGSTFTDGGALSMTRLERKDIIENNRGIEKFIRPLVGSQEFINGIERWCFYIKDKDLDEAKGFEEIKIRLESVKKFRNKSKAPSTVQFSDLPHKYKQDQVLEESGLIVPRVSSIRRNFIPIGFIHKNEIVLDSAQVIYNANINLLGVLSSKIHSCWIKVVAGRLKSDYRYSSAVCYNHFPFPHISDARKQELTESTFRILEERERHPEKTLAELYDPDKMPPGLREAHRLNDLAVERCYRSKPFTSDEERLEYLFKLYEKMIQEEKERDTLFAKEKKKRKKRN